MYLEEIFEILNRETLDESNAQLWVHNEDSSWSAVDYYMDSYDYEGCLNVALHLKSKEKPNFNPKLLEWYNTDKFENLWVLLDKTWTLFSTVEYSLGFKNNYVYLYQDTKPTYHYLQTRIANMLLETETKPQPKVETKTLLESTEVYQRKPHVHKDVIQKWLDDTNQKVWYWSKDYSVWGEMLGTPQWDDDMFFAVGYKPTEPPAKMLRFPWGTIQFYAPEDIESDVNALNTNYGSYGVFTQGYYYFTNESHRELFKRALTEYQDNFNKFLKGEFE